MRCRLFRGSGYYDAMRKLAWLGLVVMAGLAVSRPAVGETVAKMPAPTGYVDDYAGVYTAAMKMQMEALCRELHDKTKAQVFVVTVHSLGGESVEAFANTLFHNWKIGEKKTDRGAMLLFAIDDHKYRIEVGYGLEGILNDAKVGDIGRAFVPELKAENYAGAAQMGLQSVVQVIADDAKVQLDGLKAQESVAGGDDQKAVAAVPDEPASSESTTGKILLFLLPFGFLAMFVGMVWATIRRGLKHGWTRGSDSGWSGGGSSFSDSSSSSSDSSSSDSFSGGDGGDSGGGGASGSW